MKFNDCPHILTVLPVCLLKDWDIIFTLFTCMMLTVVGTGRATVTYDYDAEYIDELTIQVGDVLEILVVEPDGQEGWVMVSLVMESGGGKIADGKCDCVGMCMLNVGGLGYAWKKNLYDRLTGQEGYAVSSR